MPASLTSHPSIGKGEERSAFSRGETCQKSGGFHQFEKGLRSGRGDARNSDFADLALCSSAACRFSSEDRTTPFRRLPLMKTAQILAGLPDICAHPGIGAARDKSPDPPCLPCLATRALLRRPLATNSHLAYRSAYGNRSAGACPAACCGVCRGGSRLVPHSHPCLSLCTIPVGKHWASVHDTPPTALA